MKLMKFFRKKRNLFIPLGLVCAAGIWMSAARTDFDIARNLEILFNLFREVNTNYVDEVDPDDLMQRAAAGMLSGLDPYTEFLSEEDMESFEVLTTGKYGGIGSLIRQKGDWVIIAQPYQGFAADKAGLKIGDKILKIDGEDAKGFTTQQVSSRMKGDPGTTFKLTVERFADGSVEELSIKRERIEISGVSYYGMLNDSIGYVCHDDFTEDCSSDIREAIMEMKKQGMKALVYDLRNNGGGILQEAVKIIGMFVPKGSEAVAIRGKSETGALYNTPSNPLDPNLPIAVLIGNGSASASEIVAGALQDFDRAVLVGQRSFGKGLVQTPRPVGYNSYVKMTTAKYYIPSGRCIQAIDYSHRDENGGAASVPDSLIREYRTANGRKVYDGGGIMPDVPSPVHAYSIFTANLYGMEYIEDFALNYICRNGFRPVDVDTFRLSEAEYAEFVDYMQDKPVEFESETKMALDLLKKTAEKEKYTDQISAEMEALSNKILKNKDEELARLKPEISKLIEDDILLYYHYAQGVVRHRLKGDETLEAALKILGDPAEYNRILASQDTRRN